MYISYTNINGLVRSLIGTQDIKLLAKIAKFSRKSITCSSGIRNYNQINRAAVYLEKFYQEIDSKNQDIIQGSWHCMAVELFKILNKPYLSEY